MGPMRKPNTVRVNIGLPYLGTVEGTWELDDTQRNAAWEMYVELVTRVPVADLRPGEGLLREALSSLYTLFNTTRQVLRQYGPDVARPHGDDQLLFAYLAVAVLNTTIRPVLGEWPPLLLAHEADRSGGVSPAAHEQQWEKGPALRDALNDVRRVLTAYAELLGQVAGVPSLIIERPDRP